MVVGADAAAAADAGAGAGVGGCSDWIKVRSDMVERQLTGARTRTSTNTRTRTRTKTRRTSGVNMYAVWCCVRLQFDGSMGAVLVLTCGDLVCDYVI